MKNQHKENRYTPAYYKQAQGANATTTTDFTTKKLWTIVKRIGTKVIIHGMIMVIGMACMALVVGIGLTIGLATLSVSKEKRIRAAIIC